MKFSKLIIKNIASVADATIDFTVDPLKNSELFLITGPTGAGKSTILDCISLALYKNTPRLVNCQMQGKILDVDDKNEINISGPLQLMRLNTVSCAAILFFIGNNNVHYRAEWSANRAHKKLDGTLKMQWELQDLDNDIVFEKDELIKKEIQKVVGLDFEQFSRTTMLAQGDFSRFLNSKDEEKAKILEKITGTEIYTEIGKKIFEITKDKKELVEKLDAKKNGVTILSDEDLQNIQKSLEQKKTQLEEQKSTKALLIKKKEWLEKEKELLEDLKEKKNSFNELYKYTSSEEYENDKQIIKDWNATSDARTYMKSIPNLLEIINEKERLLDGDLKDRYVKLLSNRKSSETILTNWKIEEQTLEAELKKHDSYQNIYAQEQTITTKLDSYNESEGVINAQNEIKTQSEAKQHDLEKAFINDKEKRERKESELKEVDDKLRKLNISELSQQKDSLKIDLQNMQSVKDKYKTLCQAEEQRHTEEIALQAKHEEIQNDENGLKALKKSTAELKSESDVLFEKYQNSCNSVNEWAQKVRQTLKVGDICPICRQQISTALPTEEQISTLFKDQKNEYDKAYKSYEKSNRELSKLEGKLVSDKKRYDDDLKKFQGDTSLQDSRTALDNALKIIGFTSYDESKLVSQENDLIKKLKEIEGNLSSAKGLSDKSQDLRKELDDLKANESTSFGLVKANATEKENAEKRIDEEGLKCENIKAYLLEVLGDTEWENNWTTSTEKFRVELKQRLKKFNDLTQKLGKLLENCKELDFLQNHLNGVIQKINVKVPDFASLVGEDILNKGNLDKSDWGKKADDLLSDISDTYITLDNKKKELKKKEAYIDQFIIEHPTFSRTDIEKLASKSDESITNLSSQLQRIDSARQACDKSVINLDNHNKAKPLISVEDSIESLNKAIPETEKKETTLNQEIGALNNQLETNARNLKDVGDIEESYRQANEVYNKWYQFKSLVGESDGKQFCKIAQSYILANLVHAANVYMKNLSKERYVLKVVPGSFMILVEDAYEGFRSRPASTISGGETFLVSLSLALALSDIGQNLSVDTLFIDEGFGTLSGDPLNDAINTLKSLHSSTGRKVGIISHIQRLKELIPTQIEVSQNKKESKSTINIVG